MFDSDFIANPYRTYNHLRTTAPLHWADKFRTGAWLVTRYADVLTGLHCSGMDCWHCFSIPINLQLSGRILR